MTVMQTYAPGTFCWADMGAPDAIAAKRFYSDLFDWSIEDRPIGPDSFYTMFNVDGKAVAALYQQESQHAPFWLSYISVESADEMARRTRELGGAVLMEPFDVIDVGRMTLIQDPTGATVALWQPKRHIGAGVVGEVNTLCWNELTTGDAAEAGKFYQGLLGWRAEPMPEAPVPYTRFRMGDTSVGGMAQIGPGGPPPHWLIYVAVDDCSAKVAGALRLGARVRVPPTEVPGTGRFAILLDPQGAAFAVIQLEARG